MIQRYASRGVGGYSRSPPQMITLPYLEKINSLCFEPLNVECITLQQRATETIPSTQHAQRIHYKVYIGKCLPRGIPGIQTSANAETASMC